MFGHQDDQQNQHVDNLLPDLPHDSDLGDGQSPASTDGGQDAPFNPALPSDSSVFGGSPAPDQPTDNAAPTDDPAATQTDTPVGADTNQLLDIKQQALQQLSPLVGHLDQSPEEKFRTTMMMIQASDNQDLVQVAYEAAQQIQDEKVKAQALLDIVNEINYFTHHQQQQG